MYHNCNKQDARIGSLIDKKNDTDHFNEEVNDGLTKAEYLLYNNKLGLLGHGGFGDVYKVRHKQSSEIFAIKEIDVYHVASKLLMESPMKPKTPVRDNISKNKRDTNKILNSLINEVLMMKKLRHPNIVKLKAFYLGLQDFTPFSRKISLVLEYSSHGSLLKYIKSRGGKKLTELVSSGITYQLIKGLEYLYEQRIVHGDVKAANILIFDNGVIKLCDFGLSFQFNFDEYLNTDDGKENEKFNQINNGKVSENDIETLPAIGSAYWLAPEVILKRICTHKSDIWSLGATIIEMLTGKPPFANYGPLVACHAVGKGEKIVYPCDISNSCKSFLDSCFIFNPFLRSGIKDLKHHEWIKKGKNIMEFVELDDDIADDITSDLGDTQCIKQDLKHDAKNFKTPNFDENGKSNYLLEKYKEDENEEDKISFDLKNILLSPTKATTQYLHMVPTLNDKESFIEIQEIYLDILIDSIRNRDKEKTTQLLRIGYEYLEENPREIKRLCLSGTLPILNTTFSRNSTSIQKLVHLICKHYHQQGTEWLQASGICPYSISHAS